ncbi:MAG: hypothetical protein ACRCST_06705 [Turicibacter sp.]
MLTVDEIVDKIIQCSKLQLSNYHSITIDELALRERVRGDATVVAASYMSTSKLSIALKPFRQIEPLPLLENFNNLIDVLPLEFLFKHDIFYSYDEYEKYLFGSYYWHNPIVKLTLPTIDKMIFFLIQYYDDFNSTNGQLKTNLISTFHKIPHSQKLTHEFIKKTFDSAFKKFIMLLNNDTLNINRLNAFINVKHLLENDFYSVRFLHWEYIHLYDLCNIFPIDEDLVRRNKEKFVNFLW